MPSDTFTIRPLISRILALVQEHPVLVLPVCVADLISFSAMHLQHALHQPLFNLVLGERSVLSNSRTFIMTPQNATKAALLALPLLWTSYVLTVFVYSGALFLTSSLVRQIEAGTQPNLHAAAAYIESNRTRLTAFILRMLVTLIAAGLILWLSGSLLFRPPLINRFGGSIGYAIGFLLEALVAACLMQPALRLLAGKSSVDFKTLRRSAATLGLITIGLQIVLALFSDKFLSGVIASQTTILALIVWEAVQSLLGALTYLPLFTGLSLLTAEEASVPLLSE